MIDTSYITAAKQRLWYENIIKNDDIAYWIRAQHRHKECPVFVQIENNQPIITKSIIGVHNGIIINSNKSIKILQNPKIDLGIVFGCRIINQNIINQFWIGL